jgi:hypothetical protein
MDHITWRSANKGEADNFHKKVHADCLLVSWWLSPGWVPSDWYKVQHSLFRGTYYSITYHEVGNVCLQKTSNYLSSSFRQRCPSQFLAESSIKQWSRFSAHSPCAIQSGSGT